ncbi:MAG: GTP-binding protein [Patescibacteria group bacterium]
MMRQPIVVLVGHIDHGKSSILEHIKNISITKKEAGGITQSLHSYTISLKRLEECCSTLVQRNHMKITLPGLLFLDSPGHAAFNTMRKRGGSLADLAILVIDCTKGVEEQTQECIKILKQYKTPFIIALNKVDKIEGWKSHHGISLLESLSSQSEKTIEELELTLYGVVEKLSQCGIQADRFDRIDDFTKTVAIVPVSAKNEDGLSELVMVLIGLAQKFLETSLKT